MPEAAVPVALFYPSDAAGARLRDALEHCRASIVYETRADRADRDSLEQSGARVVIVDLDAGVDSYLDDMQNLLAGCDCRVVFNDGQVSSGLSGWDHARWLRHLDAKIRGRAQADPPRPPGAAPVPTRTDLAHAARAAVGHAGVEATDVGRTEGASVDPAPDEAAQPASRAARPAADAASGDEDPFALDGLDVASIDTDVFAPDADDADDEPVIAPHIEERDVEPSDAPDFSGWSIDDPVEEPAPAAPAGVPDAATFGVDLVDPEEFLAPRPAAPAPPPPRVPELELVPLEVEQPVKSSTPDHENWFDLAALESMRGIWLLVAATGGAQALRSTLADVPADYPGLFLVVQQTGETYIDVLLEQLAGACALHVRLATPGERVRSGDVLLVPGGEAIQLDRTGTIRANVDTGDLPVEHTLRDLIAAFGPRTGVIAFSGAPIELLRALRELRARGGEVWVQDPASCLVGALAEAAVEADVATFAGSPAELAERLAAHAGPGRPPDR